MLHAYLDIPSKPKFVYFKVLIDCFSTLVLNYLQLTLLSLLAIFEVVSTFQNVDLYLEVSTFNRTIIDFKTAVVNDLDQDRPAQSFILMLIKCYNGIYC